MMCCRYDYRFSTYFSSECTQLRSVQLFNKAYYYYYCSKRKINQIIKSDEQDDMKINKTSA